MRPHTMISVALLLVGIAQVVSSDCSIERGLEMDKCASRLGIFGDKSFRAPKTIAQVTQFCSDMKTPLACIHNYSRDCLTSLSRQILNSIIRNARQLQGRLCANDKSKQDVLNKLTCLSDDKIEQFHKTVEAAVARLEFIASGQVKKEEKIIGICCSGQLLYSDLQQTVDRLCSSDRLSHERTGAFMRELVSTTFGEFFNLLCSGHSTHQECKSSKRMNRILPDMETITSQVHQNKLKPKSNSFVSVLLTIMNQHLV